ncbi:hypothetical protein HYC85_003475 [Camellia sinensis]|uniref:Uncharacterized protein n=1 Tax=Camellia sinensis TaxID=4442 RepID=A0A7J7HTU7_CAMSI|nr:hypothetical protein HYC85_003475 [Camellia sinensis]
MGYSEKLLLLSRNISFLGKAFNTSLNWEDLYLYFIMDKLTTECVSDRSLGSKVDFGSNRATPIDEALNANPIQGFVNNISESQSKVSMENVPRHLVHEKQRDSTFEGRVDGPNLLDRRDEHQDQAMDLQVIADRLQRLKNHAINPLMATSTPDRWSEMVEEEPRTFHNIPDSLDCEKQRYW